MSRRPLVLPVIFFLLIPPHAAQPAALSLASAEGLLHLRVKQHPFEQASSIQVTVKNIRVQKSNAPKGPEWITVTKGEKTFELVGPEQGEGVVAGRMLPEGLYSRLQMDLVSVKVTLNGEQKPAKVAVNRLREIRSFDIDMARVCIVSLDFDAARSLAVAESGDIQFKPVLRLLVRRGSPG